MMGGSSPWMALGGAGLGLLKGELIDRPKEERQRKLAAETIRYSPWTGMQAQAPVEADPWGSAMQGGMAGMGMGQGMDQASQGQDLQQAKLAELQAKTKMYNSPRFQSQFGQTVQGPEEY